MAKPASQPISARIKALQAKEAAQKAKAEKKKQIDAHKAAIRKLQGKK